MNKYIFLGSTIVVVIGLYLFSSQTEIFTGNSEPADSSESIRSENEETNSSHRKRTRGRSREYTWRDLSTFKVDELDAICEFVISTWPDPDEQQTKFYKVMCRMSSLGEPEMGIKKSRELYEPGHARNVAIGGCFAELTSIETIKSCYFSLESDSAKDRARFILAANFCEMLEADLSNLDQFVEDLKFLGPHLDEVLDDTISQFMLSGGLEENQDTKARFDQMVQSEFRERYGDRLFAVLSDSEPFLAWEKYSSTVEFDPAIGNEILRNMVHDNPIKTLSQLNLKSPHAEPYQWALAKWARWDARAAYKWFEENFSQLTAEEINYSLSGLSKAESQRGKWSEAWNTAGKISDPKIKKAATGQIWQAERNVIRKKVENDPLATQNELLSENSPHADYWLEASVSAWLEKDSEAVYKWYDGNWKTLPAEKAQYVAAAFAKKAVAIGDLAAAGEWAEKIHHQKTRERIQSMISKAQN